MSNTHSKHTYNLWVFWHRLFYENPHWLNTLHVCYSGPTFNFFQLKKFMFTYSGIWITDKSGIWMLKVCLIFKWWLFWITLQYQSSNQARTWILVRYSSDNVDYNYARSTLYLIIRWLRRDSNRGPHPQSKKLDDDLDRSTTVADNY